MVIVQFGILGHLVIVSCEGSFVAWDIQRRAQIAAASLRDVCRISEIEAITVTPIDQDVLVRLAGGLCLAYQQKTQMWTTISGLRRVASLDGGTGTIATTTRETELEDDADLSAIALADTLRLEANLLAAARLGATAAFREHLRRLVRHCASQGGRGAPRLRGWCDDLCNAEAASVVPLANALAPALVAMGMDAAGLLSEVVLPALLATPGCQELHAEIAAMCVASGDQGFGVLESAF